MQDEYFYKVAGFNQQASGTITITDYTELAGKTITVNANVLTEGTDFARGASNNACATALAAAINALANVSATAVGNVITIKADAPGVAGNAYNLLTDATAGITLSGATLAGGVAASYTPSVQISDGPNWAQIDTVISITAATGSGKTLTITPQVSLDNENWIDKTATAALSTVANTLLATAEPLTYLRYKLVIGGTVNPQFDFQIRAKASLL